MYFWLDLETTGLDPHVHSIIECAVIRTDLHLKELDRFEAVVEYTDARWSLQAAHMHTKSGLVSPGVGLCVPPLSRWHRDVSELDETLVRFVGESHNIVLAGNSVHFDHGFLRKHCPTFNERLSHRHLNVSVLRDIAPAWWPELKLPKQQKPHRAMADIEQSLELARFFRDHLAP